MFDKLIDFLISIIELFRFFWVIRQWEEGIVLRFGKYTKNIGPGFHFIYPLTIDEVHTINIVPDVVELEPQTIVMQDKAVIVIQAIVKYQVTNSKICLVEVGSELDALKQFTQGAIHTIVSGVNYNDANVVELEKMIMKEARFEVSKWGIKIHDVTIKSFGKMNSLRLIQ
jgi:regulator of protease activity HflC (stomatin/prohibitin superfamily)